jgi:uncharacterized protein YjbI with pentapeptide repeats
MGRSQGRKNKMAATLLGGSDTSIRGAIDPNIISEKKKTRQIETLLKELAPIQQAALIRGLVSEKSIQLNLDGADLSGRSLYGLNLTSSSFEGTNFQDSDLGHPSHRLGSVLNNTNFKNADCRNANLEGVHFQSANLEGASLSSTSLSGSDFWQANLKGVEFNNSYIFEALFSDVETDKDTTFTNSEIEQTQFVSSNLDELSFYYSKIYFSRFSNCSLNKALFEGADLNDVVFSSKNGIECGEANFSGSSLQNVHFAHPTNFQGAKFKDAVISEGDFFKADFNKADLGGTTFKAKTTFFNPSFKDSCLTGTVFNDCSFFISNPDERKKLQGELKNAGATVINCSFEEPPTPKN